MRKTKDPVVYIGGPRTEEGKQRASQNSIKHGLFARNLVLLEGCFWQLKLAHFGNLIWPTRG
jgi:hypothetical protein